MSSDVAALTDRVWRRTPWLDADRRPGRAAFLLSLLHGALLSVAFAPLDFAPAAFVCIIPLLAIAQRTSSVRRSAVFTALGALPAWCFLHVWIMNVSPVGYPFLAIYLSLYPALFVAISAATFRRIRPGAIRAAALATIWIGLDALRGHVVFHGYPWFYVGHPTIDYPLIAQSAAVWGVAGISFLITLGQTSIFEASAAPARKPRATTSFLCIFSIAALLLVGASVSRPQPSGETVRISLLQTNVALGRKITWSREQKIEDFQRFLSLTREAASSDPPPDLIVWPETMFPGYALNRSALEYARKDSLSVDGIPAAYFADELFALQREIGTPLLVGALAHDNPQLVLLDDGALALESDGYYNSVFLIDRDQEEEQRYDKLHLTPFGEVMPYISAIDWLENLLLAIGAGGMKFDLDAGDSSTPLQAHGSAGNTIRIATPICFEVTMPSLCRRLTYEHGNRNADVLIALTNDAWFGDFLGGRARQLQLARWRAIELGLPIARAANTGISGFIGTDGSLIEAPESNRYPQLFEEGLLAASIELPGRGTSTLYGRFGDIVGWTALALTGVLLIWMMLTRRPDGAAEKTHESGDESHDIPAEGA